MENQLFNFEVAIYQAERYNDTLSKGRCRVFYKYGNRNGSYITEEFADRLISTIPYTPVKGIYSVEEGDYGDHGERRDLGRIYGIVPENPNFAWEKHVDVDGVEREYACVDVLIFSALYEEAVDILGKSLSMELYSKTLKGEWQMIDGDRWYVFEDGCFLGLQILGDDVEPCFEGAEFFSLCNNLKEMLADLNEQLTEFNKKSLGGITEMPEVQENVFKLSDSQKYGKIFNMLNPEYNEEGDWKLIYGICDVYEEYALVVNYETDTFERVYYTKNDEEDTIELGEREKCYILDVTENEKQVLDKLHEMNNNSFEMLDTNYAELIEKNSEFEQKIEENEATISTLTVEKEDVIGELNAANDKIESLTADNDELREYKNKIERENKERILDEYSNKVSSEILEKYSENLDTYSVIDLDKELAYETKKNGTLFNGQFEEHLIPTDKTSGGLESILDKYEKK